MKFDVVDLKNEKVGDADLDDAIFAAPVREYLFWEVVNWQRARRRAGTHKVKGRSEVRGGGKKPWRQKGTGRARHGTIRSPLWVGGGTVHGPSPRDYSYSMPKKKRKAALRSALSMKARDGQLRVVDSLEFPEIKTKFAAQVLETLEAPSALFVDATSRDEETNAVAHNDKLRLSVRNLKDAKYLASEGLNVEDVLRYDVLVLSQQALDHIQEVLKR
ncbi:50S ribosomal protein L4 [Persicimonas caeni]|jgi:large subunit ribosomal protein L4|uniref:Large ribosomal subunit protein uL4 n=1 Tax=Persicimonas caeni TaxID=2292766 RepID=A0A4Y6PX95_PERCE|nr:50S ribosomal protein L4 [Persicimonas caeni]QDG52637.1 50S ribosomal protein L4 [Persicimonas caeni]QED33859.1 50S ribosomal protein L4 [Persicimonas caeni]